MRPLSSIELLQVWEDGMDQSLLEKSLRLLGKAYADGDYNLIGHLSIGERDARLLQLREWMFGSVLKNRSNCPKCKEEIEWETKTEVLYLQSIQQDLEVKTYVLEKEGYSIHFRLPDTYDVLKVITDSAFIYDQKKIVSDCILEINHQGEKIGGDTLPETIWDSLDEQMGIEDPQADIRMNIHCPNCSHDWEAHFDIVSFLWTELHNWAQRLIQEVGLLARSFGWSEKDILNMSERRRQNYLKMIG